eukprot:NODE_586_length_6373_cov_0.635480.p1 type:complete len:956 gc:universal NODE_586_length_6373_cov_0.635480:1192-4059(+)
MFKKESILFGAPRRILGFDEKENIIHKKQDISALFAPFSTFIKGHTLYFKSKKTLLPCTPHAITMTETLIVVCCVDQIIVYNYDSVYLDSVNMDHCNYLAVAAKNVIGIYGQKVLKLFKYDHSLKLVLPSRIESRDYKLACFVQGQFIAISDHCIVVIKDGIKDIIMDCKNWHNITPFLNGFLMSSNFTISSFSNLELLQSEQFPCNITQMVSNVLLDKVAVLAEDLYILSGRELRSWSYLKIKPSFHQILDFDTCVMKPIIAINSINGPFLVDYEHQSYLGVIKCRKIALHVSGMYLITLNENMLECWQIHAKEYLLQWKINEAITDVCISKSGQHFLTYNTVEVKLYQFWTCIIMWCFEPPSIVNQFYLDLSFLVMLLNDKSVLVYNVISGEQQLHKYYDVMPSRVKLSHNSLVVYLYDSVIYKNERINATCWYSNEVMGYDKGKIQFNAFTITPHLSKVRDIELVQASVISTSDDGHLSVWTPIDQSPVYTEQTFSIESALLKISFDVNKEELIQQNIQKTAEDDLVKLNDEFETSKINIADLNKAAINKNKQLHDNDIKSSMKRTRSYENTIKQDNERRKLGLRDSRTFYEELKQFEHEITSKLTANLELLNHEMKTNEFKHSSVKSEKVVNIQSDTKIVQQRIKVKHSESLYAAECLSKHFAAKIATEAQNLENLEVNQLLDFGSANTIISDQLKEATSKLNGSKGLLKSLQLKTKEIKHLRNTKYSQRLSEQKRIKYLKRSILNIEESMSNQMKAVDYKKKTKSIIIEKIEEFEKFNFVVKSNYNENRILLGPLLDEHSSLASKLESQNKLLSKTTKSLKLLELNYSWHTNYFLALEANFKSRSNALANKQLDLNNFYASLVYLEQTNLQFWPKYKLLCLNAFEKDLLIDVSDRTDNKAAQLILERLNQKKIELLKKHECKQSTTTKQKKHLLQLYNDHQLLNVMTCSE